VCHALLQDPKFFRLLHRIDQELAAQRFISEMSRPEKKRRGDHVVKAGALYGLNGF